MSKPKDGDLQVYHVDVMAEKAYSVSVENPVEGHRIIQILRDYDLFQHENGIRQFPQMSTGLEEYDSKIDAADGWCTWYNEDGYTIEDMMVENGKLIIDPDI